jgi:chromosome partitioning protein
VSYKKEQRVTATSVVVLSGKGGTAKTLWQMTVAGEASRVGIPTLLIDVDPERNLSNRFNVPQHSTGLGSVFEDAGVTTGEGSADAGAKRLAEEILETPWLVVAHGHQPSQHR